MHLKVYNKYHPVGHADLVCFVFGLAKSPRPGLELAMERKSQNKTFKFCMSNGMKFLVLSCNFHLLTSPRPAARIAATGTSAPSFRQATLYLYLHYDEVCPSVISISIKIENTAELIARVPSGVVGE